MDRITNPEALDDDRLWIEGDDDLGIEATPIAAQWLNDLQEEICGVVEGFGAALDPARQDQLYSVIQQAVTNAQANANATSLAGVPLAIAAAAEGDVLTVSGGQVVAAPATAPASPVTPMAQGSQYCLRPRGGDVLIPGQMTNVLVSAKFYAQRAYYVPFAPSRAMTLDALGVTVRTAVAGAATLGIYDSVLNTSYDSDEPLNCIAVTATEAIDTGSTGTKSASLLAPVTLEAGVLYFVAISCDVAAYLDSIPASSALALLGSSPGYPANTIYFGSRGSPGLPAVVRDDNSSPSPFSFDFPAIYLYEVSP